MPTQLLENKKLKLFAAQVFDAAPYLKASRSYLADQIGPDVKCGMSRTFYLPDPGKSYAGTTNLDITNENKETFERPVTASALAGHTSWSLSAWERVTKVEDFVAEFVRPRGTAVAAAIEKDVIAKAYKFSDGAKVYAAADFSLDIFAKAASSLRGTRASGKFVGFGHPDVFGRLGTKAIANFLPSEIAKKIWADDNVGRFMTSDWQEDSYMPIVETGDAMTVSSVALGTDGYLTFTGTNLVDGAAFTLTAGGTAVKAVDLNGLPILSENLVVIVTGVNAAGTSATSAQSYRFSLAGSVEQTNPNAWGDGTATLAATSLLAANTQYSVLQCRTSDALEWDTYKFADVDGCTNETQSFGGISCKYTGQGNVLTVNNIKRIDVPYIGTGVDGRLSRVAYIAMA